VRPAVWCVAGLGYVPDFARAAYRLGDDPVYRDNYLGVRLVCSSPIF
jgi:hypothetical protein